MQKLYFGKTVIIPEKTGKSTKEPVQNSVKNCHAYKASMRVDDARHKAYYQYQFFRPSDTKGSQDHKRAHLEQPKQ